jgi:hypothetical protein
VRIFGRSWALDVDVDYEDATSAWPTPNEHWRHVDASGHEHRYERGYPTLRLVVDESHWCDGTEGFALHDGHEQTDRSHYECAECGEVVVPAMDPPGMPKMVPGRATAALVGYRSSGARVTARLTETELETLRGLGAEPADADVTALLDAMPDERVLLVEWSA